jgi:hypothetical protein
METIEANNNECTDEIKNRGRKIFYIPVPDWRQRT